MCWLRSLELWWLTGKVGGGWWGVTFIFMPEYRERKLFSLPEEKHVAQRTGRDCLAIGGCYLTLNHVAQIAQSV